MDKQIIIDGCDVSGCEYIDKNSCCNLFEGLIGTPCSSYHFRNCHYKQLKRKEEECEELKKTVNEAQNSGLDLKSFLVGEAVQNEYEQQLEKLKQECEELKELNTRLDRQREAYWKGYQKLDKALTEIKEIAEDQKDVLESMRIDIAEQILNKINEVLDADKA